VHQVLIKLGHSCSKTYDTIQKAFGKEAIGCTQVKEWFGWFKEGGVDVSQEC